MTQRNATMFIAADGRQLGLVKEDATECRRMLARARTEVELRKGRPVPEVVWLEFTAFNGRRIHMRQDAWTEIAVLNEVMIGDGPQAPPDPNQGRIVIPHLVGGRPES